MRLTYSVELSPRAWVPVALLEGRIASTLGQNLECVRDFVADADNLRRYSRTEEKASAVASRDSRASGRTSLGGLFGGLMGRRRGGGEE